MVITVRKTAKLYISVVDSLNRRTVMSQNQSVVKAINIVDAVAMGDRNLKAISERVDIPTSTVHRMLQTLISLHLIRDVKGIGFTLGTKLITLGNIATQSMPLKHLARPFLEELKDLTNDTVHLGIKDEDQIFYLDKIPGNRTIQLRSKVGDRLPIAATGIGKSLMIDMPKTEWHRLIQKQLPNKFDDMLLRMERYSQGDYSFDLEDNEDFVRCVAAPIRNKNGNIIAAISVTSIKDYMDDHRMNELIPIIQSYSEKISNKLN